MFFFRHMTNINLGQTKNDCQMCLTVHNVSKGRYYYNCHFVNNFFFKFCLNKIIKVMSNTPQNESKIVISLRHNIRNYVQSNRTKNRHNEIDSFRIAPDQLETHAINLHNFDKDDVLTLVKLIKKNKKARPIELLKLSHAFLQSTDNIKCFLDATNAINIIIKEFTGLLTEIQNEYKYILHFLFTGSNSEKQVLAIECLCNLSLGSEMLCQKVSMHTGTYLHTFLQSSNEALLVKNTSLIHI